ncbi:MAG: hypothetical protein Ct9H300mP28_17130 [Pseudomonadota bacterium]|nr:MAG: hypothetical protein Ct9H300mP28_17130 [Pseudomonadota bacterium]
MALALTPEDVNLFRNVPQERRKFFNRIISFKDSIYIKNFQEYSKIISKKKRSVKAGKY